MDKLASIVSGLTKSYLYTHLAKDVGQFVRRNLGEMEFDKEYWLHKAGLTPYRPAASTAGGFALFLVGAVAGAGIALALAPSNGRELRTQVKDRAMTLFNRAEAQAPLQTARS